MCFEDTKSYNNNDNYSVSLGQIISNNHKYVYKLHNDNNRNISHCDDPAKPVNGPRTIYDTTYVYNNGSNIDNNRIRCSLFTPCPF